MNNIMADKKTECMEEECDRSPATSDSRKRPLDSDSDNGMTKKSHYIPDVQGDGTYHLKILVPSIASGAVIGKGGETIAHLQKETGARVKMSKVNDFYPGTTERVCLITGNVEAIMSVLAFIMEKVKEKPDPNAKCELDSKTLAEREKQLKILVPNSTAGMIIGKAGAYIKQIKEETGAYVQISQKAKDQSLAERCITIMSNDLENTKNACLMILAKIVEDPQSGTCLNVSYADVSGPVANPNPTGSPFANTPISSHSPNGSFNQTSNALASQGSALCAMSGLAGSLLCGGVNLTLNLSTAFPAGGAGNPLITGQLLENVRTLLRGNGFTEQPSNEVCQAIATLINYGIIGLGLPLGGMAAAVANQGNIIPALMGASNDSFQSSSAGGGISNGNNGPYGPIGTTVAPGLNLGQGLGGPTSPQRQIDRFGSSSDSSYDPFRRQSGDASLPLNANSFGLGTPLRKSPNPGDLANSGADAATKKVEMEVGEHIVGAILGPGGKNLVEIQQLSGVVIQISKKGNYAPGTRNRVVTITGHASGVTRAQLLIENRISEEETKRARQNALINSMN